MKKDKQMAKAKAKVKPKAKPAPAPPAPPGPGLIKVRIITDRGPWFKGKPLTQNTIVDLPPALAQTLIARNWAEPAKDE
jgi:hypothetical protein